MKKFCTKCKIEKEFERFSFRDTKKNIRHAVCKECDKARIGKPKSKRKRKVLFEKTYKKCTKKRVAKSKSKRKRKVLFEKTITHRICNKCGIKKELKLFSKNKSNSLERNTQCRICVGDTEARKEYYKNPTNKERIRKQQNESYKKRIKTDEVFMLKRKLQIDMYNLLKERGYTKDMRTEEMLGCTVKEFREYIKKQWKLWMTWENHGLYNGKFNFGWDYDHIIPICKGITKEKLIELFHYTNYQP